MLTDVSKRFVGWVILSCKSLVLLSVSAFGKKIVLPTSIMEELIVRLLLTNAAKNGPWVSYTFLQKPGSFKRLSILEENCGADIINVTFKCKTFGNKGSKTCSWMSYTFLQKPCSFKRFSILEENCVADINNVRFKCKTFVDKCCKKRSLSKLYFPTKARFF